MPRPISPALAAALILLSGCGGGSDPSDTSGDPGGSGPVQLEHVHGLGVDPEDGALYAGTHHGLFRADEGSVDGPIAGLEQDFMGFTVAGPDHFLASGHPGPGQDAPAALGLLESTDGGETWETRSLAGKADFHALTYRHDTAYGVNAVTGELLASTDLESWETRSTEPLVDVAISPDSPDVLLATSQEGPVLSEDGGRSFTAVDGAPLLVFVEWLDDGTVVGVDPHGTVQVRAAGEEQFTTSGALPGTPEAFHAADADRLFASVGGRLYVSTDGGRGFSEVGAD